MSRDNLFPQFQARGVVRRLFVLCALSSILLAATAAQSFAQRSSASRPVARLISSSERVEPLSVPPARMWTAVRVARNGETASMASGREPAPVGVQSVERRAFDLINAERVRNHQAPLAWDAELCRMAELHSQRMAQQNFFSHSGPDGSMEQRALSLGIRNWTALGENIAYNRGIDDPAGFAVERWMNSEGHRVNILNARFNRSAIGAVRAPDGRIYLTQVFMAR